MNFIHCRVRMTGAIPLYLDFASPYAYFAIDAADKVAAEHGRSVLWRPVLLWAILKAQGLVPPLEPPAKRVYLLADMARSALFYGLPYKAPRLPLSSHKAARLYYALEARDAALARAFGREIFSGLFVAGADISDAGVLEDIGSRLGISREAIREGIDGETGRRRLAEAIDEATAAGVFGSPWFVLDGETFFGADRVSHMAWKLKGKSGERR